MSAVDCATRAMLNRHFHREHERLGVARIDDRDGRHVGFVTPSANSSQG
jgi:hypothetical protein